LKQAARIKRHSPHTIFSEMRQTLTGRHTEVVHLVIPTDRPVCLDLFSGGGGAAYGYMHAGFRVICIDNNPAHAKALGKIGAEFHCMDWAELVI